MGLLKPRKRRREMLEFSLNITSLMDVLTVLLFFLLKSLSVSASSLSVAPGLELPSAEAKAKLEETVTVSISSTEVRANGAVLMRLNQGTFDPAQIGDDHVTLVPLKKYLDQQFTTRNRLFPADLDKSQIPPGRILIQADKGLKFATLKMLLHTASLSGYGDYQFIVNNPS